MALLELNLKHIRGIYMVKNVVDRMCVRGHAERPIRGTLAELTKIQIQVNGSASK